MPRLITCALLAFLLVINTNCMYRSSKPNTRNAIEIFVVSDSELKNHREKFALPIQDYISWYKSISEHVKLSPELHDELFINNERLSYITLRRLFDYDLLKRSLFADYAYFYLDRPFAETILEEMESSSAKKVYSDKTAILEVISKIKSGDYSGMVEYSKRDGWFDYKEAVKQIESMK